MERRAIKKYPATMEEDRGGSARENEGGLREAREVDPRGNAEEEEVNGTDCLSE